MRKRMHGYGMSFVQGGLVWNWIVRFIFLTVQCESTNQEMQYSFSVSLLFLTRFHLAFYQYTGYSMNSSCG